MALFENKNIKKNLVGKVTIILHMDNPVFNRFGGIISPITVVDMVKAIGQKDPGFRDSVFEYMQEYEVIIKNEEIPDPGNEQSVKKFVRNIAETREEAVDWYCLQPNAYTRCLVIAEHCKPNEALKLSNEMAREYQSCILAQRKLDGNNEKKAQRIIDTYKKYSDFNERESHLRKIGLGINNHDAMVLIANRAVVLGKEQDVDVSIRVMEAAWDGIAGWEY